MAFPEYPMFGSALRIRVTHKIAAIGAIGLAGLALVGAIYLIGDAAQEGYRLVATDTRTISDQVDRLSRDLLESRRAEKDFLLRSDEKYAKRHAELAKTLESGFDALGRQIRAAGLADLDAGLGTIRTGFAVYLRHFNDAVDPRRKLGLTEEAGLEGTLRKSVHE